MKKMMIAIAMVMMAMGVNAQTLIKAAYSKGDVVNYEIKSTSTHARPTGGSIETTITYNAKYSVLDASEEGYVIEAILSNLNTTGPEEATEAVTQVLKPLMDIPVTFITDANGAPQKIKDFAELEKKHKDAIDAFVDDIFKSHAGQTLPLDIDNLKDFLKSKITEESELTAITGNLFEFNGQTITNGEEVEKVKEGIKVKSVYNVTPILGTTVITEKENANMTEEETKAMILQTMRDSGAGEDQIKMLEDNWSQFVAAGMAKIDEEGNNTYRLLKNGWIQSGDENKVTKAMGSESKSTSSVKLTDKNF